MEILIGDVAFLVMRVYKGEKLEQFQLQTKESVNYFFIYKVKYTDKSVHSSTKTDDREEEGISVVTFGLLFIFSIKSANEATVIPVTIYSIL